MESNFAASLPSPATSDLPLPAATSLMTSVYGCCAFFQSADLLPLETEEDPSLAAAPPSTRNEELPRGASPSALRRSQSVEQVVVIESCVVEIGRGTRARRGRKKVLIGVGRLLAEKKTFRANLGYGRLKGYFWRIESVLASHGPYL
jgi:hypothetical protein